MTKSASTRAILVILAGGTLATLAAGCRMEEVAIGQQDATGGQFTNTDAAAGGAGGVKTSAGGAIASGGSVETGGTIGAGGTLEVGGANASGGSAKTGGIAAAGGANPSGGTTGAGGSGAGGSTGCAPGWTMCCGQCLSPQMGVCAPCLATGGAGPTGGVPSTGGRGGAGTGGTGAGGLTGAGGSMAVGGSTGVGGSGAGGASGAVCGGLRGMSCSTDQFCDLPAGSCSSADMTGTCVVKNMVCSAIYQPVCGCNGRTYGNDCERISASVTKRSSGACATTDAGVCPVGEMWCPGCPSLGIAGGCGQVCTAMACPAPDAGPADVSSASCGDVTTQAACDSRSDCHSVFVDPGTCACAALGCCARFDRCADGGRANCTNTGTAICLMVMPHCESPYVVSYTGSCYEGCVLQTECAVLN